MIKRFNLAAYYSIAVAVLSIPTIATSILTGVAEAGGSISGLTSRIITSVTTIIMCSISIYILVALRQLFEQRYEYRGVSTILKTWITLDAAFIVASAVAVLSSEIEKTVAILSLIGVVVIGIMSILYGIKLLSFNEDLYGFRSFYAGTSIAAGVCNATVILIPLGILVGIASSIFVAVIFFREAESMKNKGANGFSPVASLP